MTCTITFQSGDGSSQTVQAPEGALLSEAAARAGLQIGQPCGGQGRCGRCAVQVLSGDVHRRSTISLSAQDVAQGYALACQTVAQGDLTVFVPAQEKIERRLTGNRFAEVSIPAGYDFNQWQTVRRYPVTLTPPSLDDQTDDWTRLKTALRVQYNLDEVTCSVSILRRLGQNLRDGGWKVTVILDHERLEKTGSGRVIDLMPGLCRASDPLWTCAIDIGTTTVTLWLVDLVSGQVRAQAVEYNGQIARGEDVISRIVSAGKPGGAEEMQQLVVETINQLARTACHQVHASPRQVVKATVAGNSTMIHLLLGIPADSIRLVPFVPAVNQPPAILARELGLAFCPDALVDCLPGVASYVGADITAGVLSGGIAATDATTLFIDIGTNGEIVLGNRDWLMTCACSAGPAFEGAGVRDGMRATAGAVEEVWINARDYEPGVRVIGGGRPRGICGSGLIALIAEMFLVGILDKAGKFNLTLPSPRVRATEQGGEYVVAWAGETEHGRDIAIAQVDVDNLLRAKAAIYAGFTELADKVGLTLGDVEQMLIAGSFGKYVNVEKAIQIGLLPDLPLDRFKFLGNTAVRGAYFALLNARDRAYIDEIASRMTYIELSADNTFYEEFTLALFLPHTNSSLFPTVEKAFARIEIEQKPQEGHRHVHHW
jgi:uncharacterized 2Fe-2S/4Fe-4S cluster protein (DUF4445 family)